MEKTGIYSPFFFSNFQNSHSTFHDALILTIKSVTRIYNKADNSKFELTNTCNTGLFVDLLTLFFKHE